MPGFKAGDIVFLKSGGPVMTVDDPKELDIVKDAKKAAGGEDAVAVRCKWFDGCKLEEGTFDPAILVKVGEAGK